MNQLFKNYNLKILKIRIYKINYKSNKMIFKIFKINKDN